MTMTSRCRICRTDVHIFSDEWWDELTCKACGINNATATQLEAYAKLLDDAERGRATRDRLQQMIRDGEIE